MTPRQLLHRLHKHFRPDPQVLDPQPDPHPHDFVPQAYQAGWSLTAIRIGAFSLVILAVFLLFAPKLQLVWQQAQQVKVNNQQPQPKSYTWCPGIAVNLDQNSRLSHPKYPPAGQAPACKLEGKATFSVSQTLHIQLGEAELQTEAGQFSIEYQAPLISIRVWEGAGTFRAGPSATPLRVDASREVRYDAASARFVEVPLAGR